MVEFTCLCVHVFIHPTNIHWAPPGIGLDSKETRQHMVSYFKDFPVKKDWWNRVTSVPIEMARSCMERYPSQLRGGSAWAKPWRKGRVSQIEKKCVIGSPFQTELEASDMPGENVGWERKWGQGKTRGDLKLILRAWILSTSQGDATREFRLASGMIRSLFPRLGLHSLWL